MQHFMPAVPAAKAGLDKCARGAWWAGSDQVTHPHRRTHPDHSSSDPMTAAPSLRTHGPLAQGNGASTVRAGPAIEVCVGKHAPPSPATDWSPAPLDNEPVEAVEVVVAISLCTLVLALLLGLACTGAAARKRRCGTTRRGGSLLCWVLAVSGAAASGTFSTIDTTAAGASADFKYFGAAAVGGNVYFAPFFEDAIGVLAVASSVFSTIDVAAAGVNGGLKYYGARRRSGARSTLGPSTRITSASSISRPPPSPRLARPPRA